MVLNPFQKHLILTKSFKKTQALKQVLRLAYVSIFSSCVCSGIGLADNFSEAADSTRLKNSVKTVQKSKEDQHKFPNVSVLFQDRSIEYARKLSFLKDSFKLPVVNRSLSNPSSLQRHSLSLPKNVDLAASLPVAGHVRENLKRCYILQQILNYNVETN